MKLRNIIFSSLIAAVASVFTGCEEPVAPKDEIVNITVRYSEVSYDYAIINVKHDGPEDITWYGFLTEDVSTQEFTLINNEWMNLLKSGKAIDVRRETERNILLEGLKEDTSYKYIVFGLTAEGEMYDNVGIGSIKFSTSRNVYVLTQTEDWEITHLGRNEDKTKEIIEIKSKKGGRFGWQYVSKESIETFNEEYPDGYELWEDDIYMNTVDGFELFALQEISTIQYYIYNGYKLADLTYIYEEGKPFEIDRLSSGEYYVIVYGFQGDGNHTQTYSVQKIVIEEEPALPEYEKWLGTYTFTGECLVTQDNGETALETRNYNIRIEKFDNNFMYRLHGWECGDDVQYDWEEDIMQLDKTDEEQFLAFPAYFRNGNLEVRESPMTYITFDGANSLILGIYGYAFNPEFNEEIPVILDGTPMASASPIADGETTTVLNGLEASYSSNGQEVKWTYSKMGYIAWSEYDGSWQTINPAMNFPITITKVTDQAPEAGDITVKQKGGMKLFDAGKQISTDFLKKDYSKLEKMEPVIYKRVE